MHAPFTVTRTPQNRHAGWKSDVNFVYRYKVLTFLLLLQWGACQKITRYWAIHCRTATRVSCYYRDHAREYLLCGYFLGVLTHTNWMYVARLRLAQHPSMTLSIFLTPLNYIWQLCLAKFSVLSTFFRGRDGTGQTGQTNRQTDRQTDKQT